jgi:hypothetical protein
MLARDPAQRPQCASEVSELFERAIDSPDTLHVSAQSEARDEIYESPAIRPAKNVIPNEPPRNKVAREVENYDVPEVWVEQASHLKTFVGRETVLMQLRSWVEASQDGGYLLLLGPWGQGKSALLAQLVERSKNEGLGCLFHTIKSKTTPVNILKFLIWQAEQLIGEPLSKTAYAGKVEDLRNSLVGALIRVCKNRGHILVVIDALDELDSSVKRLNFLPKYLPAGVRVILSCRDESPQASVLKSRLQPTVLALP